MIMYNVDKCLFYLFTYLFIHFLIISSMQKMKNHVGIYNSKVFFYSLTFAKQ